MVLVGNGLYAWCLGGKKLQPLFARTEVRDSRPTVTRETTCRATGTTMPSAVGWAVGIWIKRTAPERYGRLKVDPLLRLHIAGRWKGTISDGACPKSLATQLASSHWAPVAPCFQIVFLLKDGRAEMISTTGSHAEPFWGVGPLASPLGKPTLFALRH